MSTSSGPPRAGTVRGSRARRTRGAAGIRREPRAPPEGADETTKGAGAGQTTKGCGHGRPSKPPKRFRLIISDRPGRPALRGPPCPRTIEAATRRSRLTKPIFSRIDLVSPGRDAARKAPAGRPAHMRVHTAARAARARQLVGSLQVRAPRCASLRLVASRCSWQTLWRPRRRAWRTSAASGRASSRSGLSASMRLIAPLFAENN